MKRLHSPSLFVTFTASFFGVLALAALLQFLTAFGVLHSVFTRGEKARAELLVQETARNLAALPAADRAQQAPRVLRAHADNADSLLIVYRDAKGHVETSRHMPGPVRYGIGEMLAGRPFGPPPGRRRRGSQEARPRFDPPDAPPDAPPDEAARRRPPPFNWRNEPHLEVVARAAVVANEAASGEVAAVRPVHRLGWGLPAHRRLPRLLLFLPIALLIAGVAGAFMFRSVVRRVRRLETFAALVAEGNLDARIEDPGGDELGRLGERLNSMAARLRQARIQEAEADLQRRRLFADITHELATPLTSIRGYTETLLNANPALDAAEQEKALQNVFEDAARMDRLLQDLLELTRLEAGAIELSVESLNWTALCHNTMTRLQPRFAEAGLTVHWDGPVEENWIDADGRRMEQVAENLLTNALRYVPRGGSVRLSLRASPADPAMWRLSVEDDGPGFPEEDLPRVFQRFYRGRATSSTPGTGLGLAIVQEIVSRHGGQVRALNRPQGGAILEVDLPRK